MSLNRPAAVLLGSLAVLLAATVATAQQVGDSKPDPAKGANGVEGYLDVHKIDPETFHAIAARLPKGQAPKIDGRLADEAWQLAQPAGRFYQREPRLGYLATEKTEFRILYDDRKIYFGVWAFDSDYRGVYASELKRDSQLRNGDQIKINIDTFHDKRNAFFFATNPLGALKDAHHVDNGRAINYDWNAVWEVKTSIDENGWYAEIAIPFSQLRFEGEPGTTTWGLNVCRVIIRKNEDAYWVPYPREWGMLGFSRMSNAGALLGLKDLPSRRRLEFVPYVAPQTSRDYSEGTPRKTEAKYGFDFRVGLTNTLTADLTYKTDFAQVEADQERVNLTRFSLFFPEKRQFFTEGAGIFGYGQGAGREGMGPGGGGGGGGGGFDHGAGLLPLYYSRRVGLYEGEEVPILAGGRVTGRVGPYAVGVMNIETEAATVRYEDEDTEETVETFVPRSNYSVVRVKRDVLAQSSFGGIFLNREGGADSSYNRTAGMDLNLVLGKAVTMTGLFAKTFSPGLAGKDLAGAFDFAYRTDRVNAGLTYLDVGENFNAEMGFIRRTDIRNSKASLRWTPRPGLPKVRQLNIGGSVEVFDNHAGHLVTRNQGLDFGINFQDSSRIHLGYDLDYDALEEDWEIGPVILPPGGYEWNTLRVNYSSNEAKRISGSAGIETGGYYGGDRFSYRLGLNLLPLETLLIEADYNRNNITFPGADQYVTNTVSTRVSYSFSPELFVKGFVQFNDDNEIASLNLLFWYIYKPGSDLYIVYNQGWDTNLPGPHFMQTSNRSLTVKLTYWLSR